MPLVIKIIETCSKLPSHAQEGRILEMESTCFMPARIQMCSTVAYTTNTYGKKKEQEKKTDFPLFSFFQAQEENPSQSKIWFHPHCTTNSAKEGE